MKTLIQLLRRPLLHVAGLSFFVNLLLLVPALFMLQVFDRVLSSQSSDTLLVLMLGVGIALGLLLVFDYLRSRLQGVIGNLVSESLSPTVARIVIAQGLLAMFDAPWAIVYVAVIWLAHPWLGVAASIAAVTMLVLAVTTDFVTRRDIEALQKSAAGATRYLEASLQN